MSQLPAIDHVKVSNRLASKLAESILQNFQLEVLAEALRDERDATVENSKELQSRLDTVLEEKTK